MDLGHKIGISSNEVRRYVAEAILTFGSKTASRDRPSSRIMVKEKNAHEIIKDTGSR